MGKLQIFQFPCRDDNYGVILHDAETGLTVSIDAPETEAIADVLEDQGLTLTNIATTHHHGDHVAGNMALKNAHSCTIVGPQAEREKIPGIDERVEHGDSVDLLGHRFNVIATGGHTLGHIAYHLPNDNLLFAGDCLFAMGCGRIFEGDAPMMHESLQRLAALPEETIVYAGHEYTLANAKFALSVDGDNEELKARARKVEYLRDDGKATLPTTIGIEKATNPFLRCGDPAIRKTLDMESATDAEVFAELRARKDRF
ncbi:MAG: hydroxyacylglutathione hydrolase [Ahrensia sp.]|nr:hydroxyacylglutathione hydrolase [Ahrensia sp.]